MSFQRMTTMGSTPLTKSEATPSQLMRSPSCYEHQVAVQVCLSG
jgi:hypothetical protein